MFKSKGKKRFCLLLALLLALSCTFSSFAESVDVQYTELAGDAGFQLSAASATIPMNVLWEKYLGGGYTETAYFTSKTIDGGTIVCGEKWSAGFVNSDAYLVKMDSAGNVSWSKTYGGTGNDGFYEVCQTSDGGYASLGTSKSYGAVRGKFYFVKSDSAGNMLWFKTFGDSDMAEGYSMQETADGGFILSGRSNQTDSALDIRLTKLDKDGSEQWTNFYGRSLEDTSYRVRQTSDGGFIIMGYTGGKTSSPQMWIFKTDATGSKQWDVFLGGLNKTHIDIAYDCMEVEDGFILAGRQYVSTARSDDGVAFKIDKAGNILWKRYFGGAKDDGFSKLARLADGSIAFVGYTYSFGLGECDGYLVITDKNGNELFSNYYGGIKCDGFNGIAVNSDGSMNICGYSDSYGGGYYMWLLKLGIVKENTPPAANAGSDSVVEAASREGTNVYLNGAGSYDPDGDSLSYKWSGAFGTAEGVNPQVLLPYGVNTVTLEVSDGKASSADTVTITVLDTTKPELTVPGDITTEAAGIRTVIDPGTASASDIFDVKVSNDAPQDYPPGTTVVTWTAVDGNGNTRTGTQNITVIDSKAPVLVIPKDVTKEAAAPRTVVDIGTATATDIFETTIKNNAPADFPVGVTEVVWTATDNNGNVSTANQRITITDTTPPVLTLPADVTVIGTGTKTVVELGKATALDLVDGDVPVTNNAPAFYPVGTTVVTFTAADSHGNTSTGTVRINVKNVAPVLEPIGNKCTVEGQRLEFVIKAADANGDKLTYSASGLPKCAVFNPSTGTFAWTPGYKQAGCYKVHFEVSDGILKDSEDIIIKVSNVSPIELTKALIKYIKKLDLSKGTEKSLIAKLEAVVDSFEKDRSKTAGLQLGAFILSVKAQKGKHISCEEAEKLIDYAEQIIKIIGQDGC